MSSLNGKKPAGVRLSLFSADLIAEDEGRWEPLPGAPGVEFKLRSLHCDDAQDWIAAETARQQKAHDTLELTGKVQAQIFRDCIAELLLVGWTGLLDDDGEPEIFNRTKALEIMKQRKWRRLADGISNLVVARSKVLYEERADLGKPSESSSATDLPSAGSLTPIEP